MKPPLADALNLDELHAKPGLLDQACHTRLTGLSVCLANGNRLKACRIGVREVKNVQIARVLLGCNYFSRCHRRYSHLPLVSLEPGSSSLIRPGSLLSRRLDRPPFRLSLDPKTSATETLRLLPSPLARGTVERSSGDPAQEGLVPG